MSYHNTKDFPVYVMDFLVNNHVKSPNKFMEPFKFFLQLLSSGEFLKFDPRLYLTFVIKTMFG